MTNIDSPTVHSSLINAKLEEDAAGGGGGLEKGRDKDKTTKKKEDMLVIQGT